MVTYVKFLLRQVLKPRAQVIIDHVKHPVGDGDPVVVPAGALYWQESAR